MLRYPMIQEPGSIDPARFQDIYTSELFQNVYEGLVMTDAKSAVIPCLAERWEISPDGRVYTFHLRSAKFHAPIGREVTANDVKYSLERALTEHPASPTSMSYLNDIVGAQELSDGKAKSLAGVEVVDPRTVKITIDKARPYFLAKMTYPTGCVVCREAIERNNGELNEQAAIGTGPFVLREYRHGGKLTFGANPDYWAGRPKLDRIDRPIVLDPATQHSMYENDELDSVPQVSLSDFVRDMNDSARKDEAKLIPQANTFYLVMHPRLQPAFKDKRVRRAFAMAIDRAEVARIAYLGTSPRADGFLPPGMPGYNPDIPKIPYDPEGARKLLAEAGYPGGRDFPSITLEYLEKQPEWNSMAQVIGDFVKRNLGITVSFHEHEAASFWTDTSDKEKLPFFITGWIADYIDPQDFLSLLLRSGAKGNHVGYSNPRFDALCDAADAEPDLQKRIPLYQQADKIAMEDVAVLPLVYYNQPMLIKRRVHNAENNLQLFFLPHLRTQVLP